MLHFPETNQIPGKRKILGLASEEKKAEVINEKEPNHLHSAHHQAFHRSLVSHHEELDPRGVTQLAKAPQLLENL